MPNTVKISKSKNLIFKKLSFLYLVFILFLFLSSPGKFVEHYQNLEPAQTELNKALLQQLKEFKTVNIQQEELKKQSLASLKSINGLALNLKDYLQGATMSGEKLKESHFANEQLLKGKAGEDLLQSLEAFVKTYKASTGKDLSGDLLLLDDFNGQQHAGLNFFFKDTPNGALTSVLEHIRSLILMNSLQYLKGEKPSLQNPKALDIGALDLIHNFKKSLAPGEKLFFKLKAESEEKLFQAWVNGVSIDPKFSDSAYIYFEYEPPKTGHYSLDFLYEGEHYFYNFTVNQAGFRFREEQSTFISQVGESQSIFINPNYLPHPEVKFESKNAEIEFKNDELRITPFSSGIFTVYMLAEGKKLDSINLYAKDVKLIDVALMDIAGKENTGREAIRLQALNPFWQVVSFQLKITQPNGRQKILRNATRFLGPDMKEAIQNAPGGSLFAFQDIRVIGKNGNTYRDGRTLIRRK